MSTSPIYNLLTPFIFNRSEAAISNQLIGEMQKIVKDEHHVHIGGSIPLSYMQKCADPQDYANLVHFLQRVKQGIDYDAIFGVFTLIKKIINNEEKLKMGVAALCQELWRDNIGYVELRTTLDRFESGFEGYLEAVLKGIEAGKLGTGLDVKLILSLKRNTSEKDALETLALALKHRSRGIVGLDISGNATCGDGSSIFSALKTAKECGLFVTLHLGESHQETAEQQLKELEEIRPDRIGHGALLCDAAKVWVRQHKVPVELCLTSALKVGMVSNPKDHFALELIQEQHPVSICMDDPLVFQISSSEEHAFVAHCLNYSAQKMQELVLFSKKSRFVHV